MAFFDELSRRFSNVSRVAVRKAKEVTDIGSLKIQIADENRRLNKLYENLGREYYDMFKENPDEDLQGLVNQIKHAMEKVSDLQEEIGRVEAESAAQAEKDRLLRESESQARKESVADVEMREIMGEEEKSDVEAAPADDSTDSESTAVDDSTDSESAAVESDSTTSEGVAAESDSTDSESAVVESDSTTSEGVAAESDSIDSESAAVESDSIVSEDVTAESNSGDQGDLADGEEENDTDVTEQEKE